CMTFAIMHQGQAITTIEGLATPSPQPPFPHKGTGGFSAEPTPAVSPFPLAGGRGAGGMGVLHPLQEAFIHHDGFQCGYCTPGQTMPGGGLPAGGHRGSDAETREGMSGNLCRCGASPNIVAAIAKVARKEAR